MTKNKAELKEINLKTFTGRSEKFSTFLADLTTFNFELAEQIECQNFTIAAMIVHDMQGILNDIYRRLQLEIISND